MMRFRRIAGIFCIIFAAAGVYNTAQQPTTSNLLLTLAFILLAWALMRSKRKPTIKEEPKPEPIPREVPQTVAAPQAAPVPKPATRELKVVYEGKVVGVSFDGRQRVLARMKRLDENGEALDFTLEQDTYQGKPSIKVMAGVFGDDKDPKQIGFIAARDVAKVLPYVDSAEVMVDIYGGPDYDGDDCNYGASVTLMVRE